MAPDESYLIPRWQKSKGWLILTAALELSTNQVTHFYSIKKNTDEMIRMADILRVRYAQLPEDLSILGCGCMAHVGKLKAHLDDLNRNAARQLSNLGDGAAASGRSVLERY